MKSGFLIVMTTLCLGGALAFAADSSAPSVSSLYDKQLGTAEQEMVSLAEAIPADKYSFAPSQGEFKGVRTVAQQLKHVAATNYRVAAMVLGEKPPVEIGKGENGPDALQSKDEIVKFLKDSYAFCHKAEASLTNDNITELVGSGEGKKSARGYYANIPIWHTFDHYGQLVVYARMNGIVPPASRH